MSGEKNELTFMRCPSCRSLVPTGSVKCRMCGFVFEGDAGDADAAQRSSGRVRQRTVSKSREEILAALEQAEMNSKPRERMGAAPDNAIADKTISKDPEPVADSVEQPEAIEQTKAVEETMEIGATEIVAATQVFDAREAPVEETPEEEELEQEDYSADESAEESEEIVADAADSFDSDYQQDSDADYEEQLVADEPLTEEYSDIRAEQPIEEEHFVPQSEYKTNGESSVAPVEDKPRVEEQPFKLKARSGSLSLRTVRAPAKPEVKPEVKQEVSQPEYQEIAHPAIEPEVSPVAESAEAEEEGMSEEQFASEVHTETGDTHSKDSVSEDPVQLSESSELSSEVTVVVEESLDEEHEPQAPAVNRPGRVETNEVTMNSNDALIGWLVSYADKAGRSMELRGKKFLVSSERIRDNDLVLEDQSISAPHCLVGRMGEGLQVQDLLSDRGIHLKKKGEDDFSQVESCTVESGDTIRFGDLEYMVVLIP